MILAAAYLLVVIEAVLWGGEAAGLVTGTPVSPFMRVMLGFALAGFAWRALFRICFTAAEYGWAEGLRAIIRIPLANIIAILAGRRALAAYLRSRFSDTVIWEKTRHAALPAPLARLEFVG